MRRNDRVLWSDHLLSAPHDAPDKGVRVRRMFNAIAPRYALVNSLFSFGQDRRWRRRAVALARVGASDEILDVACGTGDLTREFAAAGPKLVVGCDFARSMLDLAATRCPAACLFCEADALALPFQDGSFSIVSCAFGVRNFADLDKGLGEMYRVLRQPGRAVILEFTRPRNRLTRFVYEAYANHVMPLGASLVSGDRTGAYRYLPRSVVSFVGAEEMRKRLVSVGFSPCRATTLTMGIVTVYVACKL